MTTQKTHDHDNMKLLPLDPWAGAGQGLLTDVHQRRAVHPAERPPQRWSELREHERELLGGLGFHVMAVHGPFTRQRLAYLVEETAGDPARDARRLPGAWRVWADLVQHYEPDPEARAQWRALDLTVQGPLGGSSLLPELLEESLPRAIW